MPADPTICLRINRRAAYTLEMAFALPILLLIVFGSVEMYRASMLKQYAENVSYEAARHVIVPGASASEAHAAASQLLKVLALKNAEVEVTPAVITDETTHVTVRVSIPNSSNQWLAPLFTGKVNAVSETTLLTERVPNIQTSTTKPPPKDDPPTDKPKDPPTDKPKDPPKDKPKDKDKDKGKDKDKDDDKDKPKKPPKDKPKDPPKDKPKDKPKKIDL